jgi:DNA mismatch endonuclease, patch repair protein
MPDVFTQTKRSEVMSRIRSRGNKDTELRLMALMRERGVTGWRRHIAIRIDCKHRTLNAEHRTLKKRTSKPLVQSSMLNVQRSMFASLRVRPDFVFRRQRVAVFVDGCFWHGCPRHATRPVGHRKFWDAKLARNKARDREVNRALRHAGWTVLRIWECALTKKRQAATMARLGRVLER